MKMVKLFAILLAAKSDLSYFPKKALRKNLKKPPINELENNFAIYSVRVALINQNAAPTQILCMTTGIDGYL